VLHNDAPDVAVARGAVAFALVRAGAPGGPHRRRLGAQLLPGARGGRRGRARGICVLPRGTEEGHEVALPERRFALRLGQPVRFHLVSSVATPPGRPGELVDLATRRLHPPAADRHRPAGDRRQAPARTCACAWSPR
jgi:hypothetical protein